MGTGYADALSAYTIRTIRMRIQRSAEYTSGCAAAYYTVLTHALLTCTVREQTPIQRAAAVPAVLSRPARLSTQS